MNTIAPAINTKDVINNAESEQYLTFLLIVGVLLHIPLAYLFRLSPLVATCHGLSMILLGIWFIVRDQKPYRLICLTAYIAGAEVLWRMTKAGVFWEFGKYSVALLILLGIFRWRQRPQFLPIFFFLLLMPAGLITISDQPLERARQEISFNLSGPLSLAIAGSFLAGRSLTLEQFRRTLIYFLFPIAGIAFLAFFRAYTAPDIEFGSHSNFLTSGGFGPNQVSAVLGLGALSCFLMIATQTNFNKLSWLSAGLMIWFLLQTFLTFSRGGVANFLGAVCLSAPFLMAQHRNRLKLLFPLAALVLIFALVLLPRLDSFTGGSLSERFSDTGTTGRWELIQKDLALWQKHFLLGAGLGQSSTERFQEESAALVVGQTHGVAAHTEYSRLLAEHGLLGFTALTLLGIMFWQNIFRSQSAMARGIKLALMTWALLGMTHQAMRLAAIGYFFALAMTNIEMDKPCD